MDLLDLFVKIGVKDEASEHVSKLSSKLGNGLKKAAEIGTKAVTMAAAGIATLTGAAVKSYADYEQLVGGVETLFKDSADKVQQYASNAYQTAGLSANEYMETVTSFSASLLQSLGGDTETATEYADMAITDMSDNANKMGTDMTMIQNAYQGFAKGNFMMLDNLKLGYGGTKTEMERLLADATELSGVEYDISSFADMVEAIHVVQTEMGITGTTALEASTTIEGSMNSAKSAFKNLVTGIADDNADMGKLMDNVVESVGTAAENILPRIEIALNGAAQLVERIAPLIAEKLPQFIIDILPGMLEAGGKVITSLVEGIIDALPQIIETGTEVILMFLNAVAENPDKVVETAILIITTLAGALIQALPQIIVAGVEAIGALIASLIDHLPDIFDAGTEIIKKLVEGLKDLFSDLVSVGSEIIDKIKEGISNAWEGLKSWFNGIWDGLFGSRDVNVNVNATKNGKPARGGLDYVPYDEYPVRLHKGEMVLTAPEADAYRQGGKQTGGITIVQNINAVPQTPVEFAAVTSHYAEQARWSFA